MRNSVSVDRSAEPVFKSGLTEWEIVEQITSAGIRLRFDKVALRLIGDLQASAAEVFPEDESIVFTVTAPIKRPAKTSAALHRLLRDLPSGNVRQTINGNEVCARKVDAVVTGMPRVMGFVHNPESNPDLILDLVESKLTGRLPCPTSANTKRRPLRP